MEGKPLLSLLLPNEGRALLLFSLPREGKPLLSSRSSVNGEGVRRDLLNEK